MVLRLSDKGKFRLNKLFSLRRLLSLLLSCGCGICLGVASTSCSISIKEEVSSIFAQAADQSSSGNINIISTSNEIYDRAGYSDVYNFTQAKMLASVDLDGFYFIPCYVSSSVSESGFNYSCQMLFDSNTPISILPAYTNSLVAENGVYRHEIWHLSMMFNKNIIKTIDGASGSNFFFISQASADRLLLERGISSPNESDYQSLLGTCVEIDFRDSSGPQSLIWVIANIYFEDEWFGLYQHIFGNFLPCYVGLPSFSNPSIAVGFGHSAFACNNQIQDLLSLNSSFGNQTLYLVEQNLDVLTSASLPTLLEKYSNTGIGASSIITISIISTILLGVLYAFVFRNDFLLSGLYCLLGTLLLSSLISWVFLLTIPNFYSFSSGILILTSNSSQLISLLVLAIYNISCERKTIPLYDSFKI